jgi:AcrR family transcriptional regulator
VFFAQAPPVQTARFKKKREAILSAAADQFNKQGIKGTTLADIAGQVGLITSSVTYYYRRKEDLALACFMRSLAAHGELAREAATLGEVGERVTRFLVLHARMMAAHDTGEQPPLIYFNDIRALPETHARTAFDAYNEMFRGVRGLLSGPGANQPLLSRAAQNARTHLLLSAAHWMRAWIGRHETDQYPRVAERVADVLLSGLAAPGMTWQPASETAHHKRGTRKRGNSKGEAFLRVATELVNDKGYRGASVEEISARLNVTKSSFYYDNETKLDLVTACFERTFSVVRDALKASEEADGPAWQRTCTAIGQLVRFQLSDEGPLLRTSAEIALPDEEHRQSVRRTHQRLTERIANMLVDGMVDGSVRPCNPAIAAQLLACAVNSAAELQRWVPGLTSETAGALYTRPALLGLLCDEGGV